MKMETSPELEFEFYLAQKLGRTVAELRQMSQAEFLGWSVYYGRKAQRAELEMMKGR
ncbi:MAG: hypothetical protein ACJ72N_27435 [Labedaea sp.]